MITGTKLIRTIFYYFQVMYEDEMVHGNLPAAVSWLHPSLKRPSKGCARREKIMMNTFVLSLTLLYLFIYLDYFRLLQILHYSEALLT